MHSSDDAGQVIVPVHNLAILESAEKRSDLDCRVSPVKPELGLDLRFHIGYKVVVPVSQLAGAGDRLQTVVRVTAAGSAAAPHYFEDLKRVAGLSATARGEVTITGLLDVGPGRYRIDWLLRDERSRVCSAHWEAEVRPDSTIGGLPASLAPAEIEAHASDPFAEQPPRTETGAPADSGRRLRILLNFSPGEDSACLVKPETLSALSAILRNVLNLPGVGEVSIVAFHLRQAKVIYEAENLSRLSLPALGEAVRQSQSGTVDYRQIQERNYDFKFLAKLITVDRSASDAKPDAVIVIGPKLDTWRKMARGLLEASDAAPTPIFYLNYTPDLQANPWTDAIGAALKNGRGYAYSITTPRDMQHALKDMMSRIPPN